MAFAFGIIGQFIQVGRAAQNVDQPCNSFGQFLRKLGDFLWAI